jgi:site-specific DNA-cytosine methylase
MSHAIQEFHLFAGVGGGILGGLLNNHTCVGAVEIDEFCRLVLQNRINDGLLPCFPIYSDLLQLNGNDFIGSFDILCGGFPCQAFSSAASGRNIKEKDLWPSMLQFVTTSRSPIVFAENVSERAIGKAEKDLQANGYRTESCLLSAACLKAPHRRNRYWLLAYANDKGELFRRVHDEASRLPKFCQGIWGTEPVKSGVAHEFSKRVDKFRAIGNAQVPVVAAVAFRVLANRLICDVGRQGKN